MDNLISNNQNLLTIYFTILCLTNKIKKLKTQKNIYLMNPRLKLIKLKKILVTNFD